MVQGCQKAVFFEVELFFIQNMAFFGHLSREFCLECAVMDKLFSLSDRSAGDGPARPFRGGQGRRTHRRALCGRGSGRPLRCIVWRILMKGVTPLVKLLSIVQVKNNSRKLEIKEEITH